jgi:3-isopropylmalate dehydrogenase
MKKRQYDIAVIAGDGTGPEVIGEGVKVVEAVSSKYDFQISFDRYDLGGAHYRETGETLSDKILESLKGCHAIYLGAVGHPEVQSLVCWKKVFS